MVSNGGDSNGTGFAKTICSICHEDFKPLIEDLQSISICGHVFHELCLHQWFEDSVGGAKKRSCPVCKQSCTDANVGRLYFQYVGEPNASNLSQKSPGYDESPEELRREVNRLLGKVVSMASTLEQQQRDFNEVTDQLLSCKDQLKTEVALKTEAVTELATSQHMLRMKSVELDKSTLEFTSLQERSVALAKELAVLKLASDLNLEEDEITNLVSLDNDFGSKETIDALRKSLVIRNKIYKELMDKCNILERGEARYLKKLEKANGKIKKLKSRVQELKTSFEIKENEILRVLTDQDIKFKTSSHETTMKRSHCKPSSKKSTMDNSLPELSTDDCNKQEKQPLLNEDENITSCYTSNKSVSTKGYSVPITKACIDTQNEVDMLNSGDKDGVSCYRPLKKCRKRSRDTKTPTATDVDDDEVICLGDTNPDQTSVHIRNEIQSLTPASGPGENCFSGGLMGPDGTNWHLGKWCKKVQGSKAGPADSIDVNADRRGGRANVILALDQSSVGCTNTSWTKKSIA